MILKLEKWITRNVHEGHIAWEPQTRPPQRFPRQWPLAWATLSRNRIRTAPRPGLGVFRRTAVVHCTREGRQRLPSIGRIYRPGGTMEDFGLDCRLVWMLLPGGLQERCIEETVSR